MNKIILLLLVALSFNAYSDDKKAYDPSKQRPTTPEERQLRKQWVLKRRYEHFGGELVRPGTQKGQITVVNCQDAVSPEILNEAISYLVKETRFNIVLEKGVFTAISPKVIGDLSLYVVDSQNLPRMLVAPEDRWAILNVASLKTGRGEKPQFLRSRVLKEMSRTFAGMCGAMSSDFPDSLTTGIYNLDQLDRQEDNRLSVDVIARFQPCLANIKVTPAEITSYRKAVQEGWAPTPTNDVQKAIWDNVRATPAKPMKIEFDPKKGR